ncbi:Protein kinase domain [Dillenia turbinata]|uniref:Protein kinase domain n=1 Tax=Dillenia turbinata TaxID=194707 RepID=A0AAN8VUN1_9MAGN
MATAAAEPSTVRRRTPSRATTRTSSDPAQTPRTPKSTSRLDPSTSNITSTTSDYNITGSSYLGSSSLTSLSSRTSLTSLRESLPENPHIYSFSEIRDATNNFLAKRFSSQSSSSSWKCSLRGRNVIIFQRKFRRKIETKELKEKLYVISRSHHMSIIKLLGASISGDNVYLVYEFVNGANLEICLRNPKNPGFTVLSTWMSRMQVASDLAHGLDYIHNNTGLNLTPIHNHIKSSSIIVTEPSFNAKICHFGTAELIGETSETTRTPDRKLKKPVGEIVEEEEEEEERRELKRKNSGSMQFEGSRGFMSPEFQATGIGTQKSDVFAFGAVILELLSGEEPLKYKFEKSTGNYRRISVIDTAKAVIDGGDEEREGRLRRWIDRRLRDSFPVEVAEKMTRLALDCVHVEADKRPDASRVANKISKMYLASRKWSDRVRVPTEISVSLAPR